MSPIYLRRHNASNMSYRISTCLLIPSKSISFVENPGFRLSHLHLFILHLSASEDRAGRYEVNYVGENGICLYNVSPSPPSPTRCESLSSYLGVACFIEQRTVASY